MGGYKAARGVIFTRYYPTIYIRNIRWEMWQNLHSKFEIYYFANHLILSSGFYSLPLSSILSLFSLLPSLSFSLPFPFYSPLLSKSPQFKLNYQIDFTHKREFILEKQLTLWIRKYSNCLSYPLSPFMQLNWLFFFLI